MKLNASLASQITLNTFVSYLGRIISSIFALISVGLMTRALGQEGFGEYTTIVAYLSMFVILADFGLQALMTREISTRQGDVREVVSSFFTLRLLSSLVFLLLGFILSLFFPYSTSITIGMIIGAVGFFFLSINQLLLSIFQKHLVMHLTALAEIAGRGAQLFFVYFIYRGYVRGPTPHIDLFWFLGAMSASSLIIFILQYIFARRYTAFSLRFNVKEWAEIVKATWPIALSIVLTLIYFKIDTIFLSLMKSQTDVGIYGVAYRVLESLIFFPAMFAGIMLPILSREGTLEDLTAFRKTFQKAFRTIIIFAVPITAGGIALAYSIAYIIGGREFLAAGAPLQALFVATGIIFFGNLLGRAIIALDLQKKAVFAYLFGVVLNIVLNFIFIPKYTYMGAAWTTVATEFLITVFLFWLVWKKACVSFELRTILKSFIAAGVMLGALLAFASPIETPQSFMRLSLLILFGGFLYFSSFFIFSRKRIFGL